MGTSDDEPRPLATVNSDKEKFDPMTILAADEFKTGEVGNDLVVTERDLEEARASAEQMSLATVRELLTNVHAAHENDPNFPHTALRKIRTFIANEDIFANPDQYKELIYEMKVEAALITNNSPYAEVRAVVSNRDDPSTPSSTVRAWTIGLGFSILLAFINQLFSIRQPQITVYANVAQLLSYPVGKLWERVVPAVTVFGVSLNPGPFNKKEHMLITIMASVAYNTPYTDNIIWVQYLPQYFNQPFAGQFAYQILMALSTNLIGYGLAGLCRRFLVYPAYCVWPQSLVTIALNDAFHSDEGGAVGGPFKSIWRASRMKFFVITFAGMFVYHWFPYYIFGALSQFSWMTWIAPDNVDLTAITGSSTGFGFNPVPTFDWNTITSMVDPLMIPFFSTFNLVLGAVLASLVAIGVWYSNGLYTAYLPINSNRVFDNTGKRYNVSKIVDNRQIFDQARYEAYSPAYLSSGNMTVYAFFFAIYPAVLVYIALNHRYEFMMGMRNVAIDLKGLTTRLYRNTRRLLSKATTDNDDDTHNTADGTAYHDIHNKLMGAYPEVSEAYYMLLLAVAVALGLAGIVGFQTYTSPFVVFYGIILCLIFVIPVGIVKATTGLEVTLNVIAEFIGGPMSTGNALAMNYFKAYGYVTCASAVRFSQDLKLAHYLKINPRHTFMAQLIATIVSSFVCTGVLNFQINKIPRVCTEDAPNRFVCPGINTFFTASVLWGTIGPTKVFGPNATYTIMLVAFPIGILIPLGYWYLQRLARRADDRAPTASTSFWLRGLRQIHPVAMLWGGLNLAPYNITYLWPALPVSMVSWLWLKNRYLGLWSRYNFVLSASWSSAVAIASIVIFFALQYTEIELNWWGNSVVSQGCEASACPRLPVPASGHFGPVSGEFH